jgi:hypothetical protein
VLYIKGKFKSFLLLEAFVFNREFHIPLYAISLNDSEISDYPERIYPIELEISDNT